jgi:2-polyprenyl-3-methyl-5-hydroxy-6-metoxy-1,4-benzoquinol methylase
MYTRESACPNCGSKEAKLLYDFPSGKYLKCSQCNLVSIDPLPAYNQMVARAEYWASKHHTKTVKVKQHYSAEFQEFAFAEYFRKMAPFKKTGRVLDIGCGIGSFIHAAERKGWDAYGIDIGPSISVAKKHNLKVNQGRLQDINFSDAYFDIITMFDVIEHINDLNDLFADIRKKLRPNGLLVIKTPNINSISSKILGRDWSAIEPYDHIILFSSRTLKSFLQKRGFKIICRKTIDLNIFGFINCLKIISPENNLEKSENSKRELIHKLMRNKGLQFVRNIMNSLLNSLNLGESLILYAKKD